MYPWRCACFMISCPLCLLDYDIMPMMSCCVMRSRPFCCLPPSYNAHSAELVRQIMPMMLRKFMSSCPRSSVVLWGHAHDRGLFFEKPYPMQLFVYEIVTMMFCSFTKSCPWWLVDVVRSFQSHLVCFWDYAHDALLCMRVMPTMRRYLRDNATYGLLLYEIMPKMLGF